MKENELEYAYRNAGMDVSRLVRDPAEGVAIAKCLLNRVLVSMKATGMGGVSMRHFHPVPCRFCQVDRKNLQVIYDEWMAWSMLEMDGVALASPVEAFMRLPAETQAALVRRAQGYEVEHVPKADRLPESVSRPHKDIEGSQPEDDLRAGGEERHHDHPQLAPGWTTGRSTGGVRSTRRKRRSA